MATKERVPDILVMGLYILRKVGEGRVRKG